MSPTARPTARRVHELESENDRLRDEISELQELRARRRAERPRIIARAIASTVLILLGALLIPSAIVANWAATEVSNTDQFVAALSPVIENPAVQNFVAQKTTAAIESRVDLDALTDNAFSGLSELAPGPAARKAIDALAPAAASALKQTLSTTVDRVVSSRAFEKAWQGALRLSHTELVAVLNGDSNGVVTVGGDGAVELRLGPVLASVKKQLVDKGFPLADSIPSVDLAVRIATIPNIAFARAAYRVLTAAAALLPWAAVVLLALGVLVARSKPRALFAAGLATAVVSAVLLIGAGVGVLVVVAGASKGVPGDVLVAVGAALTGQMRAAILAVLLLGVVVALVGFVAGASAPATAIRRVGTRLFERPRAGLRAHGLPSRSAARALHRFRYIAGAVGLAAAVAVLVLLKPLTAPAVVIAAVVLLVAGFVFALLNDPPAPLDPLNALPPESSHAASPATDDAVKV
jgi:hypothetical protein